MPSGVYKRTKPVWNKGLTAATDARVAKSRDATIATVEARYGKRCVLQSKEVLDKTAEARHSGVYAKQSKETKQLRYGDPNYNNMCKNRATKLARYGNENYNNQEKYKQTSLELYGTEHPNQNPINSKKISDTRIRENAQEKAKQTIVSKYGDMQSYYSMMASKRYRTMRINNTLGNKETGPERELYKQLCEQYGKDNVVKQYFDEKRYPFKCDFYIVPEDKFIELHGFWTHGPHPFDKNSQEDIDLLEKLQRDNTAWSNAVIYTWTDLDVRKLQTAKKNNLNYEAIYWYGDKNR